MSDYKDRLQALMDDVGVDRAQLAAALGVSYQAVRKVFENGGKFGSINNITAAQYFGVSSDWLATGKGEKTPQSPKKEYSQGAMDIANLYDMIPESDHIQRAKAYSGATSAIVSVLEKHATEEQAKDQKKQSA